MYFDTRYSFTAVLMLLLLFLAGVIDAQAQSDSLPLVRAVQTVPDAPTSDIYYDNVTPPAVSNLRFPDASVSYRLSAGTHNVKIVPAGLPKEANIFSQDLTFNRDTAYTVFATGRISTLDVAPVILTRNLFMRPAPGNTSIRVVNTSDATGPVTITIVDVAQNSRTISNVAYRSATGYQEIPAGTFEIDVSNAGGTIFQGRGSLPSGGLATLVPSGNPAEGTFKMFVLIDNNDAAQVPMDSIRSIQNGTTGFVRFNNLVPNGEAISIFVDGATEPLVANLGTSSASEQLLLEQGMHPVVIKNGAGTTLFEGELDVVPDSYRAFSFIGSREEGYYELQPLTADITANPNAGRTKVRFFNGVYGTDIYDFKVTFSDGTTFDINASGFGSFNGYRDAPAGATTVSLFRIGETTPLRTFTGDLPADTLITLILSYSEDPSNLQFYALYDTRREAQQPLTRFQFQSGVDTRGMVEANHVAIYPNPASSSVTIEAGSGGIAISSETGVRFTNIDGTEPTEASDMEVATSGNYLRLNLEGIPNGTYIVTFNLVVGTTVSRRLIILR